jgi:hypothetical protein
MTKTNKITQIQSKPLKRKSQSKATDRKIADASLAAFYADIENRKNAQTVPTVAPIAAVPAKKVGLSFSNLPVYIRNDDSAFAGDIR